MENKFHQELWNSLGAAATPMSSSELYTALEQGTVDGEENPIANFYSYQFQEVQKYITMSNHIYSPFLFDMSKKIWDTYDADTQAILSEAAKAFGEEEKAINRKAAAENLQSCIDDYGIEVTYLTDDAKAEFEALRKKLKHNVAKDMDHSKETIKQIIEGDIVAAYYYQAGAWENGLHYDSQVKKATEVLLDKSEYDRLLSPKGK